MEPRGLSLWVSLLSVGAALPGCATQRDTAQALTIAGAAAVVIGASMAADEQRYDAGPGEGGVQAYCARGLSKGARTTGKGLAVAGVGLAAAGYALTPKGPDRTHAPRLTRTPCRLVRRAPEPPPNAPSPEAAAPLVPSPEPPDAAPAPSPPAALPPAAPSPPAALQGPACAPGASAAAQSPPDPTCAKDGSRERPRREPVSPGGAPAPHSLPEPAPPGPR